MGGQAYIISLPVQSSYATLPPDDTARLALARATARVMRPATPP
jgi:hypothetical protein